MDAIDTPAVQRMTGPSVPLLQVVDLHKHYSGVRALRGANLQVSTPGTVHGLAGENGSGKSTLLAVLSGQVRPDRGSVLLDGREVNFSNPLAALAEGVAMVSQERALALNLSIAENVLLGRRLVRTPSGISWSASHARAAEVLARLGLDYDTHKIVGSLRPDQQQMVEVARALSFDARVVILDEPTSSLTDDEVEHLFNAVRALRSHGVCTIFVSHRLPELFALTDEVTVLRDGTTAASGPIADFDAEAIINAMVGERGERQTVTGAVRRNGRSHGGECALAISDLSVPGVVRDVNLEVRAGEIVGLAGLVGAGRSELLEAIFGLRPTTCGTIAVNGVEMTQHQPRTAVASGLGYLPADRKTQGLVMRRSIAENLTMVKNVFVNRLKPPSRRADLKTVEWAASRVGLTKYGADRAVDTLSGGNQQKVAIGKWLAPNPSVLLLDEPTRGVDVAAKADIHQLLRSAAADGMAIVASSSENPELLGLCDRIHVMYRGRLVASLDADAADEALIARYAGGHT